MKSSNGGAYFLKARSSSHAHDPIQTYRKQVRPLAPYMMLWGTQWTLLAMLQYIWVWPNEHWLGPATFIPAFIFTLWLMFQGNRQSTRKPSSAANIDPLWLLLLLAMSVGAIALMDYIQVVDRFFLVIFPALLVSIGYTAAGKWLGKPIALLGIWLFALTVIMSIGYLGFTPTALRFFTGLSLIVGGWMIRLWNVNPVKN